jgi:hypothetical protein
LAAPGASSAKGESGIGLGRKDGKPVIVIMVERLTPGLMTRLPKAVEGHPVVVEESGEISAF